MQLTDGDTGTIMVERTFEDETVTVVANVDFLQKLEEDDGNEDDMDFGVSHYVCMYVYIYIYITHEHVCFA
jgi:hypothetical protein